MEIHNLSSIENDRIILLLGRPEYTFLVSNDLLGKHPYNVIYLPDDRDMYYADYPHSVEFWSKYFEKHPDTYYILKVQNEEYIDVLLDSSSINFSVATVRKAPNGLLYIKYRTKQEAYELRVKYNMELRM